MQLISFFFLWYTRFMKYVGYTVAICSMIQNVGAALKIIDYVFLLNNNWIIEIFHAQIKCNILSLSSICELKNISQTT